MSENVHEGHRARVKQKFREHGLESFTDIEALELLLFFAIPRSDTNVLAHALLKRFRDFRGVMQADLADLQSVPGIGENAATLLHLVKEMNSRYLRASSIRGAAIHSTADAGAFLRPLFSYCGEERSGLLCLDAAGCVIDWHILAEGTTTMVSLAAREIVDLALRDKAASVIMAHNHVSGVALPSKADVESTSRVYRMLNMIGVRLLDHLIFSEADFVSMRDSGHFAYF